MGLKSGGGRGSLRTVTVGLKLASTVSRDPDDSSTSKTETRRGVIINPNSNLSQINVVISSNTSGLSEVGVVDTSNTVLASQTGSYSAGDEISLSVSLSSGTKYHVYGNNGGNSFPYGFDGNASFPYTSADVDIVGASKGTSSSLGTANDPSVFVTVKAFV